MGLGGQEEELSSSTTPCQLQKLSITDLKTKIISRKESSIIGCIREEYKLHLLYETDYPSNSANEKLSSPWTLTFLQWIFVQNSPSQLARFSLENNFPLLCVLDLHIVLAVGCLSWTTILCSSGINSFLLVKELTFISEVNRC